MLFPTLFMIGSILLFDGINGQGLTLQDNILINSCDANVDGITISGGTCGQFTILSGSYVSGHCRTETFTLSPSGAVGVFPTFTFPPNYIVILWECQPTSFQITYYPGLNCDGYPNNTLSLLGPDPAKGKTIHVSWG